MKAPVAHEGYGKVAKGLLRWAAVPATIALLCLLPNFFMYGTPRETSDRARLDMRNLEQALTSYRERAGSWPPEQGWVEALVERQLLERAPLDPWDRPYRYRLEALDGGERRPVLISLGRDGQLDTDDDLNSNEPVLESF